MYIMQVAPFLARNFFTPLLAFIDIFCRTKVDYNGYNQKPPDRTFVRVAILNERIRGS